MWWFLFNPAFYGILEVEAEINATLERLQVLMFDDLSDCSFLSAIVS